VTHGRALPTLAGVVLVAMTCGCAQLFPQRPDDRVVRALARYGIENARIIGPRSADGITAYMFEATDESGGYIAFDEKGAERAFSRDIAQPPGLRVLRFDNASQSVGGVETFESGWLIGELDDLLITRVVIQSESARQEAAVAAPMFLVKLRPGVRPEEHLTWVFYDASGTERRHGGG
jgi:hypothetical protein